MSNYHDYDDGRYSDRDNQRSGYECAKCGYEPTWKETDRGSCPRCVGMRIEKAKLARANETSANNELTPRLEE